MIAEIEISDIRNVEHMVLKPGALNIISGDNGCGKTTILMAIAAVFEGGHNPNLRRRMNSASYCKKGVIAITLDDGKKIVKTITEKSATLTITSPDGTDVAKPQDYVATLASGFAFDPISFCEAKPKDRLDYLQRALNISFSPAEVKSACGLNPPLAVDLDGLDLIRKQVFEERTQENTRAKQAAAMVARLSIAITEVGEHKDWSAEVKRIHQERDDVQAILLRRRENVSSLVREERAAINADIDSQIAVLNNQRATLLEKCREAESKALSDIDADCATDLIRLQGDLSAAQENERSEAQREVVRREIEFSRRESEVRKKASDILTTKLDAIDALKKQKLESLPITGVELRNGIFFCDGLPFDDLNTGEQYLRAFQVAALQPGKLGLMIADRAEALGEENFAAFKQAALDSGFQVFVTRVTNGELDIEAISNQVCA